MNLMTVKTLDQVALKGVSIEWEKIDNNVRRVIITDQEGRSVQIKAGPSYSESVSVLIPEPPKKEIRYVLHGDVAGIPIKKAYETAGHAEMAMSNFASHASNLEITQAEVIVDDAGDIAADDLPF